MSEYPEQLQQTEKLSLTIHPYPPHKEQNMGKLASFLAGVITGAVALGVTACIVEKHTNHEENTANSSSEDKQLDDIAPANDSEKDSENQSDSFSGATSLANEG